MNFIKSRTALIALGAAMLLFSIRPAAAFDLMEQRKALSTALDNLQYSMPRMAPQSQAKALNVASDVMIKLVEIDHLRDLEDLLVVTNEPAALKLLTERLSSRRKGINMSCRILANSWPIFTEYSQDAVLIGEIMETRKVIERFCAGVRNR